MKTRGTLLFGKDSKRLNAANSGYPGTLLVLLL